MLKICSLTAFKSCLWLHVCVCLFFCSRLRGSPWAPGIWSQARHMQLWWISESEHCRCASVWGSACVSMGVCVCVNAHVWVSRDRRAFRPGRILPHALDFLGSRLVTATQCVFRDSISVHTVFSFAIPLFLNISKNKDNELRSQRFKQNPDGGQKKDIESWNI